MIIIIYPTLLELELIIRKKEICASINVGLTVDWSGFNFPCFLVFELFILLSISEFPMNVSVIFIA